MKNAPEHDDLIRLLDRDDEVERRLLALEEQVAFLVANVTRDAGIRSVRVKAGLEVAKKKGKRVGRPRSNFDRGKVHALRAQGLSLAKIAAEVGVSTPTVLAELRSAS